ncbi:MAG: alpha/beta hydrolase [Ardenticatenales bacterium]|nr:alpha/beta hydrolase [Ardenticatenales bacterium]
MIPSHWTENTLTVDGVALHYWRTGNGDKPALVLQHGFSDNALCWLQTALDLEEQYDILMADARGHGQSERIQPGKAVDMAADLAGLIKALELENPIVGGHSMGAMITYEIGVRFPEIARALLLEDPPWFVPPTGAPVEPPAEHPMAPWVDTCVNTPLDQLIADTRVEHPNWPEWVINTWCPAKKELDPNILSILSIRGTDWLDNVAKIDVPALLVTADPERGGIVTPEVAARVGELNPGCTIVHIPGTGHHVRFEDYGTYMTHLRAFLASLN